MTNRDKYKALHHDELIDRIVELEGQLEAVGAGGVGRAAIAAPQLAAQPITPADSIYGLLAWLSGRDEIVTLSARHGAAIAADLAKAFCEANGLQQFSADYPNNLKYPHSPLSQAAQPQPSGNAGELPDAGICENCEKEPAMRYHRWCLQCAKVHFEAKDQLIRSKQPRSPF